MHYTCSAILAQHAQDEVEQENAISPNCRQPALHTPTCLILITCHYLLPIMFTINLRQPMLGTYSECTLNTHHDLWSKLKLVSVLWDSNSTLKSAREENSQLINQANKDKECLKLTFQLYLCIWTLSGNTKLPSPLLNEEYLDGKPVLLFVLVWGWLNETKSFDTLLLLKRRNREGEKICFLGLSPKSHICTQSCCFCST